MSFKFEEKYHLSLQMKVFSNQFQLLLQKKPVQVESGLSLARIKERNPKSKGIVIIHARKNYGILCYC